MNIQSTLEKLRALVAVRIPVLGAKVEIEGKSDMVFLDCYWSFDLLSIPFTSRFVFRIAIGRDGGVMEYKMDQKTVGIRVLVAVSRAEYLRTPSGSEPRRVPYSSSQVLEEILDVFGEEIFRTPMRMKTVGQLPKSRKLPGVTREDVEAVTLPGSAVEGNKFRSTKQARQKRAWSPERKAEFGRKIHEAAVRRREKVAEAVQEKAEEKDKGVTALQTSFPLAARKLLEKPEVFKSEALPEKKWPRLQEIVVSEEDAALRERCFADCPKVRVIITGKGYLWLTKPGDPRQCALLEPGDYVFRAAKFDDNIFWFFDPRTGLGRYVAAWKQFIGAPPSTLEGTVAVEDAE